MLVQILLQSVISDSDAIRILRITLRNIVRSSLYLSFTGYHFCSCPCVFLWNIVFSCVKSFCGVSQFQLFSKGQWYHFYSMQWLV